MVCARRCHLHKHHARQSIQLVRLDAAHAVAANPLDAARLQCMAVTSCIFRILKAHLGCVEMNMGGAAAIGPLGHEARTRLSRTC
jgi:hypothetical protein